MTLTTNLQSCVVFLLAITGWPVAAYFLFEGVFYLAQERRKYANVKSDLKKTEDFLKNERLVTNDVLDLLSSLYPHLTDEVRTSVSVALAAISESSRARLEAYHAGRSEPSRTQSCDENPLPADGP